MNKLENKNIRIKLDDSDERLSKKIREAQISKIPYQLVIGDNELKNKTVSYRLYSSDEVKTESLEKFISNLEKEINK